VISSLKSRFALEMQSVAKHPFMTAAVLDPQLKKLPGVADHIRSLAYSHVCKLTSSVSERSVQSQSEAPAAKRQRLDDNSRSAVLQFLGESDGDGYQKNGDFDAYLSMAVDRKTAVDILQWWKTHESQTLSG